MAYDECDAGSNISNESSVSTMTLTPGRSVTHSPATVLPMDSTSNPRYNPAYDTYNLKQSALSSDYNSGITFATAEKPNQYNLDKRACTNASSVCCDVIVPA